MSERVMDRTAADNVYFHPDFHGTMNIGIAWLREQYGEEAVRDYIRQFVRSYLAPLRQAVQKHGLAPLRTYWEGIYAQEGGDARFSGDAEHLVIETSWCPARQTLDRIGIPVDPLFFETTRTLNQAICEDSDFESVYESLDAATGASRQTFRRRTPQ